MIAALVLAAALAAAPAAPTCTVDDATLTWGFKETFRSYISGTIANGEWIVSDGATYETPYFGFSGGTGSLDGGIGTISFEGAIEFTGHGGILDTIVSNPQLVFDGSDTATLLLDVSGTTQEGEPVGLDAVEFATVDLETATQPRGVVEIDGARVTLTAEGADAFGTYDGGELLDPIVARMTPSEECGSSFYSADNESWGLGLVGLGLVGLLIAVAGITVLVAKLRPRRAT